MKSVFDMQVRKVPICSSITCHKSLLTTIWLSYFHRSATFCRQRFTSTSKRTLANASVCR